MIRMNRRISFFNKEVSSSFQFRNILNFWSRRVSSICETEQTAVDNRRNTSFFKGSQFPFLSYNSKLYTSRLSSFHILKLALSDLVDLHRGEKDEHQFLPLWRETVLLWSLFFAIYSKVNRKLTHATTHRIPKQCPGQGFVVFVFTHIAHFIRQNEKATGVLHRITFKQVRKLFLSSRSPRNAKMMAM